MGPRGPDAGLLAVIIGILVTVVITSLVATRRQGDQDDEHVTLRGTIDDDDA